MNEIRRTTLRFAALLAVTAPAVGQTGSSTSMSDSPASFLSDSRHRWRIGLSSRQGLVHFGLDSEGTGREKINLLASPAIVSWVGPSSGATAWRQDQGRGWACSIPGKDAGTAVTWTISRDGDDLIWRFAYSGEKPAVDLNVMLPFDPLMGAAVLIPARLDPQGRGLGPWLLMVPDAGHLRVEAEPASAWLAMNDGTRGGSPTNAPAGGVDPRLRGKAWLEAVRIPGYTPGRLTLRFASAQPVVPGTHLVLRFRPQELPPTEGIDASVWRRIRRPYLNNWQPCGTWAGPQRAWVLANNVLSDPASISLSFYAEPMLFWHTLVPGIDVKGLLRHSLDYWLHNHVSAQGHVNAFGHMYDLYPSTGAFLIIAAWDYWVLSRDSAWLNREMPVLHRMGDYLQRRDVDKDGLIESYGSGNAGTLRDPDRADVWFEMMNFGWKNAWANAVEYRAFVLMAEMLEAAGQPRGAEYYRGLATRLRQAYVGQLLSPQSGWFVSWVSQDGKIHDYCHTFVNGAAVAYGIVDPQQGRQILSRVVAKSRSIGFDRWNLGVPGNLIPCRKEDMISARIGMDGQPIKDDFHWPESLTEKDAFGYRYPNGTIHPALVWYYLLGLQVAGLSGEADRILDAMIQSAQEGLFQNGIVNAGYGGAEHFYFNGRTCGYEGYLPESYNFLMAVFTRSPAGRQRLLGPLMKMKD
jgi:hypothetical protein